MPENENPLLHVVATWGGEARVELHVCLKRVSGNDSYINTLDFSMARIPKALETLDLPSRLRRHVDKARHIIDRLNCEPHWVSRSHRRRPYIALHSREMQHICGTWETWKQLEGYLVENNVIETDGKYIPNSKSTGYRLVPVWELSPTSRVTITDRRLTAKLRLAHLDRERREDWQPVHFHLARFLYDLEIDSAQVSAVTGGRTSRRKRHARTAAAMIEDRRFRLSVDDYGRVHTNVTNLWSRLRPALRWRGQSLTEIDVAGSQPLIVGAMAAQRVFGNWTVNALTHIGSSNPDAFANETEGLGDGGKGGDKGRNPPLSYVHELLQMSEGGCVVGGGFFDRKPLPEDLQNYLEVCERGRFYEELADVWRVDLSGPKERGKIKKLAMKLVFFGRIRFEGALYFDLWERFYDRWPSVGLLLMQLKDHDKGIPARASQRLESSLIIDGACERLMRAHPGIPLVTVHDSVLTIPEHFEIVRAALSEAFGRIGVKPLLRVK